MLRSFRPLSPARIAASERRCEIARRVGDVSTRDRVDPRSSCACTWVRSPPRRPRRHLRADHLRPKNAILDMSAPLSRALICDGLFRGAIDLHELGAELSDLLLSPDQ